MTDMHYVYLTDVLSRTGADDFPFVTDGNTRRTWGEFTRAVNGWKLAFTRAGVKRAALYFTELFDSAAALFGAWAAGVTAILPADTARHTCDRLASGLVDACAGNFPEGLALPRITPVATDHPCTDSLDEKAERLELFTSGSTGGSVMYAQTVEKDTTIKGTVAVNFSALTENTDDNGTPIGERDALMVSAMLVDIAPEGKTFPAFNTSGSYVPKTTLAEGGAWMGGGLPNYDLTKLKASDVTYKIISRGWMDLCNPGAGFDSHTADTRVALDGKTYHDYTIYLQSTVYEVEAGHTLALVIYAYEPGMAKYTQNYQITIDNSTVSADIPVNAKRTVSFADVSSDSYCADAVKWAVENGVTNGTTATTFSPNAACTRGQIATFLYRYMK